MKHVKIKIETLAEAILGDQPINDVLHDISSNCHRWLEYSTSKNEECERLYEDQQYEELYSEMQNRISVLEGALCRILNLLED